jgi:hypothetical protein
MASPEPIALELVAGTDGDGVLVEFDAERIRALDDAGGEAPACWRLSGELDPERVSALRVVCARFDDGRLLAVAASRPSGAAGHGEESVRAALVDPAGSVTELTEALLSTEYDSDGRPTRIGLELYADEDAAPLRVAADREADAARGGGTAEPTPLRFRMEGVSGTGRLELVTPG